MSRYIWDVGTDTAALATLTLNINAACTYGFSDSGSGNTLERVFAWNQSYVYTRTTTNWADSGAGDGVWNLADGDFVVARYWPRRRPNASGLAGDPADESGLFIPYHRNVNSWPINRYAVNKALAVSDGGLSSPSNAPGTLVLNNYQATTGTTWTESINGGAPSSLGVPVIYFEAALNRIVSSLLSNQWGWDFLAGLTEDVGGTPANGFLPGQTVDDGAGGMIAAEFEGWPYDDSRRSAGGAIGTSGRKTVEVASMLVGASVNIGNALDIGGFTAPDVFPSGYDTVDTWNTSFVLTVTGA